MSHLSLMPMSINDGALPLNTAMLVKKGAFLHWYSCGPGPFSFSQDFLFHPATLPPVVRLRRTVTKQRRNLAYQDEIVLSGLLIDFPDDRQFVRFCQFFLLYFHIQHVVQ